MKVNITVDDELMKRADEYADENYMSRSGLISLALNQYLQAQSVYKHIQDLAFATRKIADTGVMDEETTQQLEDFERFAKLLTKAK